MPGEPKKKSNRGGPRPGSGRPTLESHELRRKIVKECEKMICDALPTLIQNMLHLANGGYEREELEYQPDDRGMMQLTKRKVTVADKDKYANQYLIDRIMGKTKQSVEISGADNLLTEAQRFVIPEIDDRPEPNS